MKMKKMNSGIKVAEVDQMLLQLKILDKVFKTEETITIIDKKN